MTPLQIDAPWTGLLRKLIGPRKAWWWVLKDGETIMRVRADRDSERPWMPGYGPAEKVLLDVDDSGWPSPPYLKD